MAEAIACLRRKGLSLSAVAVSAGPGSYTGLRIGSSLAKGLCHGFDIPLIAISTLALLVESYRASLAEALVLEQVRIMPMLDARRSEVYTARFDALGARLEADYPLVLSAATLPHVEMKGNYVYHFVGNGAGKTRSLWPEFTYTVAEDIYPEAQYMQRLAVEAYEAGDLVDAAYWAPSYLKDYRPVISKNKVLG